MRESFYVPKTEQNYACTLEAFGLARVLSRLGNNVDVKIINRGWAYEIFYMDQVNYEKLLSPEAVGERKGKIRMRAVQREATVRYFDKTGTLGEHPALGQQTLNMADVRERSFRYGNAPPCSAGRLMAASRTQSLGYQDLLVQVAEMDSGEFTRGLADLLDTYRLPGKKQDKKKTWPFQAARFVQILFANKLAGVWGEKVTCTKKWQKGYQHINAGRLWLTSLGYYQASIAVVNGGDVQLIVVEPLDVRLHSVAGIVDYISRFSYSLNSFSYAHAYAINSLVQLLLEREEQLDGIWSTIYLNKGQGSVCSPVAFKYIAMPRWLRMLSKEKRHRWYWNLSDLSRPIMEVSRSPDKKVPPRLMDELSNSYVSWVGNGNSSDFFRYVLKVNMAFQQHIADPARHVAPSWPMNGELLSEVVYMDVSSKSNFVLKLLEDRENNGFDEVAKVIRALTVGGMLQEKRASEKPQEELFKPPLIRHDLLATLLNLVQNPKEFRRHVQEAVVRYNELAAREYAELKDKKEKGKSGFWYPTRVNCTKWMIDAEENKVFQEAYMLLLADASSLPGKKKEDGTNVSE